MLVTVAPVFMKSSNSTIRYTTCTALAIFFTATPRTADLLLVVGPVSENMREPLLKTYAAMPDTKRVMAVGTCAITGGVFGRSFMSAGGVGSVLPVDLEVPGNPPPPLAILHGLLVASGRKDLVMDNSAFKGRRALMISVAGTALLSIFVVCGAGILLSGLTRREASGSGHCIWRSFMLIADDVRFGDGASDRAGFRSRIMGSTGVWTSHPAP